MNGPTAWRAFWVAVIVCCGFFVITVSGSLVSTLQAGVVPTGDSGSRTEQTGRPAASVSDQLSSVDANLATADALLAKTADDMTGPGGK